MRGGDRGRGWGILRLVLTVVHEITTDVFFLHTPGSPGVRSTQDRDGRFLLIVSCLSGGGGSSSTVVYNPGKNMDLSSLHLLLTWDNISRGVVRHAQCRTRGWGRGIPVFVHVKTSDISPLQSTVGPLDYIQSRKLKKQKRRGIWFVSLTAHVHGENLQPVGVAVDEPHDGNV